MNKHRHRATPICPRRIIWPFVVFAVAFPPGWVRAEPSAIVGNALLPHDLSPWSLFLHADFVVKVVIAVLAFASVVTWTITCAKGLEVARAMRRQRRVLAIINNARSLKQAALKVGAGAAHSALIEAAWDEMAATVDAHDDRESLKQRIGLRLERIEANAGYRIARGIGLLATISASAPFVGLFGTVWGIMNSFVGISKTQTTNLTVVAPGIAESLLATACGLVVAIPAVMIYNHFARQVAAYKILVADVALGVLQLALRDLSRHTAGRIEKPTHELAKIAE